jgi:tetratricopeptide (TPR) repeat protein
LKLPRALAAAAAITLLAFALPGCRAHLIAEPMVIPTSAREPYEHAKRELALARDLSGEESQKALQSALAAAREARAAAPEDFRLAVLEQDVLFALDPRDTRESYASRSQATAEEKVLVARALLPERIDDARDLLVSACEQDPKFAWAFYGLAFVERRRGRADVARANAEEALRLDPKLNEALELLVKLYHESGDRKMEILARQRLIDVTHGDPHERHKYAQLLLDADDRSDATEAEKELRVILAGLGDPPPPEAREFARDVLVDLGTSFARRESPVHIEQSVSTWRRALALDHECLVALYNIGIVEQQQRRDLKAALAAFEEYMEVAQSLSGPLPAAEVYNRYFNVPSKILDLRQKLGMPLEKPPTPRDPFAQPVEPTTTQGVP